MTGSDPDFGDGGSPGLDPELLARAIAVCRGENQRSISLLQRRLGLGYTTASDLLDVIAERGLDGQPPAGDS